MIGINGMETPHWGGNPRACRLWRNMLWKGTGTGPAAAASSATTPCLNSNMPSQASSVNVCFVSIHSNLLLFPTPGIPQRLRPIRPTSGHCRRAKSPASRHWPRAWPGKGQAKAKWRHVPMHPRMRVHADKHRFLTFLRIGKGLANNAC